MEKTSKPAIIVAIGGLICNIPSFNVLTTSIIGIPVSIVLGIFGIALAVVSKDPETGKICKRGKVALVLSIIALVFGALTFILMIEAARAMADPEMSRVIIDALKSVKDQLPENMQQMFEQAGIPLN